MKEEYKTCPNCGNMVDKKDKECPYCLTPLSQWSIKLGNYNNNSNNNTQTFEDINNDTIIKNDNEKSNNEIRNNIKLPPLLQTILDAQNTGKFFDKEEVTKKAKKIFTIFLIIILAPSIISFIYGIIAIFLE